MKIEINIPDAFVSHYERDSFTDSLMRVIYDIRCYRRGHIVTLSGRYEEETLLMLREALCSSKKLKSIKQRCSKAYNKGYEDGVEYAEQNPPIRPNY